MRCNGTEKKTKKKKIKTSGPYAGREHNEPRSFIETGWVQMERIRDKHTNEHSFLYLSK